MTTVSIAAFVKRRYAPARTMSRPDLLGWLQWFINRNALAVAKDGRRIVGVGMVRPVATYEETRHPYTWNPFGEALYCELAVASHPRALPLVWLEMLARFSQKQIWFFRPNKGDPGLRKYDTQRLTKHILKGA